MNKTKPISAFLGTPLDAKEMITRAVQKEAMIFDTVNPMPQEIEYTNEQLSHCGDSKIFKPLIPYVWSMPVLRFIYPYLP